MAGRFGQSRSREHGGCRSRASPDAVGVDEDGVVADSAARSLRSRPARAPSIGDRQSCGAGARGGGLRPGRRRFRRSTARTQLCVIAANRARGRAQRRRRDRDRAWRMCGTFAALSIAASRAETSFSRLAPGSPVMFDGLAVDAMVARNKMGGTGRHVRVRALVDPIPNSFEAHPHRDDKEFPVRISASS